MGSICQKNIVGETYLQIKQTKANEINYSPGIFILENQASFHDVYSIDSKLIGKGLYGEVRLCTHRRLNHIRAVKIIKKDNENMDTIEKS